MTYSIGWQANSGGYVIIPQRGHPCLRARGLANDAGYSEAFVRGEAKRRAEEIAASLQSLSRPTIDVHEGRDLWD